MVSYGGGEKSAICTASSCTLTEDHQKQLHQSLISLRQQWCQSSSNSSYLLVGEEVCTGLNYGAIMYIINNFHDMDTEQKLLDLGIRSYKYCTEILQTLQLFK